MWNRLIGHMIRWNETITLSRYVEDFHCDGNHMNRGFRADDTHFICIRNSDTTPSYLLPFTDQKETAKADYKRNCPKSEEKF